MQITISKLTRKEREEFFRKNKWLIHRLWGIRVCFPDIDGDDDGDGDHLLLQKHVDQHQSTGSNDSSLEDLQEELEELEEEIEEALEEIEEDLEEMVADGVDEKEAELLEELGEVIDDIQEVLEDADSESDSDCPDDLTTINGLGPKTADGLIEAGITSFQQVAELSDAQIEALDEDIRNFAKSYTRKDFRQQAKDLL
ncbi:MAG: helix-hairpin-helix domain-containing protein [Aureispira sp.]